MSGFHGDFNSIHAESTPLAARKLYRADRYLEDAQVASSTMTLSAAVINDRFAGNNGEYEIETLDEFLELANKMELAEVGKHPFVFQEVDFSPLTADQFNSYHFKDCQFWGCIFPKGTFPRLFQFLSLWRDF